MENVSIVRLPLDKKEEEDFGSKVYLIGLWEVKPWRREKGANRWLWGSTTKKRRTLQKWHGGQVVKIVQYLLNGDDYVRPS